MKFLTYKVAGVLQQDETGSPAQVGDQVKMFLDQQANPELPEFVFGIIQPGIRKAGCCEEFTIYKIGYAMEEFTLRPDDVINLTTTAAVDVVAQDLANEIERAITAEEQLQENIDTEEAGRIAADTAEQTARINADNALDGRLDVLEADSVRYTSQAQSSARQEQARSNLGMGNRQLKDSSGGVTVDWENSTLTDPDGAISVDWNNRFLKNASGQNVLGWYSSGLNIPDTVNFNTGTITGSTFGTTTSQKIGFHGATATVQRAGAAQAAVVTTAPTTGSYGYTQTQAAAILTLLNEIRATLVEKGIMKGSA